jgi:hypothetical protein
MSCAFAAATGFRPQAEYVLVPVLASRAEWPQVREPGQTVCPLRGPSPGARSGNAAEAVPGSQAPSGARPANPSRAHCHIFPVPVEPCPPARRASSPTPRATATGIHRTWRPGPACLPGLTAPSPLGADRDSCGFLCERPQPSGSSAIFAGPPGSTRQNRRKSPGT